MFGDIEREISLSFEDILCGISLLLGDIQERDIAMIIWRYQVAKYRYCMEDVVNNLASHGHHEQLNENENITNKQRIKKGQNSST